jgi:hypothetical protein
MKFIVTQLLILSSLVSFCQRGKINGRITKSDTLIEFYELTVILKHGDSVLTGAVPDQNGNFTLKEIPDGYYKIVIKRMGYRDDTKDTIKVEKDTTINLTFGYPPPCVFTYVKGHKPSCINGHMDHIIPIKYGLPTTKTMKKAKKGLVHLGGCMITDCDPQYYCTIHKIEL